MHAFNRLWDPWADWNRVHNLAGTLAPRASRWGVRQRQESPAVNAWQSKDGLLLRFELPGFLGEDFDITVERETLTIVGHRKEAELQPGESYLRRERIVEPFERTIRLPFEVDPEHTVATYLKGVLTVELHRPEAQKPKKVNVKSG